MKKSIILLAAVTMVLAGAYGVSTLRDGASNPSEARAEDIPAGTQVSTWDDLKSAVKNATNEETIVVTENLNATDGGSDRLVIDKKTLTIDLNGHTIRRNRGSSSSNGHVIEIQGNSTVTVKSTGGRATLTGGYAENGGAVNIHEGSSASFNNITFSGNKASVDGGAIFTRGTLTMENCEISGNEAKDTGGGIYVTDKGDFALTGVTITNNTAKNDGGAINAHLKEDSTITGSTISHNTSSTEDGGGISLDAEGKMLSIYDSVITYNACEDNGGGIDVEDGTVVIHGTEVSHNSAKQGGGVYFDTNFTIGSQSGNSSIANNSATEDGGGIYNNKGTLSISSATFTGNNAQKKRRCTSTKGR